MALLERVTTLIRANLNELIEKAEDPDSTIKQVILDMENQLIQVKTQVASAMADQHLLEKRRLEMEQNAAAWMQKAELAIEKGKEDLAKAALERSVNHRKMAEIYRQQEADQKAQAELMKSSLKTLGEKLAEAKARRDLLLAQHRRARGMSKVGEARATFEYESRRMELDNLRDNLERQSDFAQARSRLFGDDVESRFASMEREDQINRLLADLKARRKLS